MEDSAVSRFHFDGAVMLALPVPGPFMSIKGHKELRNCPGQAHV